MGAVSVTGRDGETIESVEEMAGWFSSELMTSMPGWKQQIMREPATLPQLECDVRQAFSRGADMVVAGLIAIVMREDGFARTCEDTRRQYAQALGRGRERSLRPSAYGFSVGWLYGYLRSTASRRNDCSARARKYLASTSSSCSSGSAKVCRPVWRVAWLGRLLCALRWSLPGKSWSEKG